jgi:hypothetical protein
MNKARLNIFIKTGLLLLAFTLVIKHIGIIELPEFLTGFLTGLAFSFQLIGIFIMTPAFAKVKSAKASVFLRRRK